MVEYNNQTFELCNLSKDSEYGKSYFLIYFMIDTLSDNTYFKIPDLTIKIKTKNQLQSDSNVIKITYCESFLFIDKLNSFFKDGNYNPIEYISFSGNEKLNIEHYNNMINLQIFQMNKQFPLNYILTINEFYSIFCLIKTTLNNLLSNCLNVLQIISINKLRSDILNNNKNLSSIINEVSNNVNSNIDTNISLDEHIYNSIEQEEPNNINNTMQDNLMNVVSHNLKIDVKEYHHVEQLLEEFIISKFNLYDFDDRICMILNISDYFEGNVALTSKNELIEILNSYFLKYSDKISIQNEEPLYFLLLKNNIQISSEKKAYFITNLLLIYIKRIIDKKEDLIFKALKTVLSPYFLTYVQALSNSDSIYKLPNICYDICQKNDFLNVQIKEIAEYVSKFISIINKIKQDYDNKNISFYINFIENKIKGNNIDMNVVEKNKNIEQNDNLNISTIRKILLNDSNVESELVNELEINNSYLAISKLYNFDIYSDLSLKSIISWNNFNGSPVDFLNIVKNETRSRETIINILKSLIV